MAERSNVFSMLEDDEVNDSNPTEEITENEEIPIVMESNNENEDNDDSSWTVQSSSTTKSRRLVPQWTLTREDLGVEQTRNKAAHEKHEKDMKKKSKFVVFNGVVCLSFHVYIYYDHDCIYISLLFILL